MTDLDDGITSVLRERAEGHVDADLMLARVVARGRTRKVRRRAVAGVSLGLVLLAPLGLAGVSDGLGDMRWPGAGRAAVTPPAPPPAGGVPGAAVRPDLVGTDPGLLHFGVDPAAAQYLSWRSAAGVESIRLKLPGGGQVAVDVGRSAEAVETAVHDGVPHTSTRVTEQSFAGPTGTLEKAPPGGAADVGGVPQGAGVGQPGWILRWQPVAGLWARAAAFGPTDGDVRAAMAVLRFDRARRCAAPFRLDALPAGARVTTCGVTVADFPKVVEAVLSVTADGGERMDVHLRYAASIAKTRTDGNRTINGHSALLSPKGDVLELLGYPKLHLTARFGWPFQGFTEADATTVLGGVRVADDVAEPDTWP